MNPRKLVSMSNMIGSVSIILLIYWVFVFISIQVFGLKVFKENLTDTFYLSIIGILALMFGALIINVMFNLTRIAQKHNDDRVTDIEPKRDIRRLIFIISFPLILSLLFLGDYLTSKKRERSLIEAAQSIVRDNATKADKLVNYSFGLPWIKETEDIIQILAKTDKNFPNVSVIIKDSLDNSMVLLEFSEHMTSPSDTVSPRKKDYLLATTKEEREYLHQVLNKNLNDIKFEAENGQYQLFYPYSKNGKRMVIHFSDYQKYGKMGS